MDTDVVRLLWDSKRSDNSRPGSLQSPGAFLRALLSMGGINRVIIYEFETYVSGRYRNGIEGSQMQDAKMWLQHIIKRGIAIVLFVLLLVGATGAVLSAVAAGVTTLGNPRAQLYQSTPSATAQTPSQVVPTTTSTGQPATQPAGQSTSQNTYPFSQTATQVSPSVVDKLNAKLRGMQSPVMARLDSGGVSLGEQVQNSFGQLLAGLLQTMFVERTDQGSTTQTNSTGGQSGWN